MTTLKRVALDNLWALSALALIGALALEDTLSSIESRPLIALTALDTYCSPPHGPNHQQCAQMRDSAQRTVSATLHLHAALDIAPYHPQLKRYLFDRTITLYETPYEPSHCGQACTRLRVMLLSELFDTMIGRNAIEDAPLRTAYLAFFAPRHRNGTIPPAPTDWGAPGIIAFALALILIGAITVHTGRAPAFALWYVALALSAVYAASQLAPGSNDTYATRTGALAFMLATPIALLCFHTWRIRRDNTKILQTAALTALLTPFALAMGGSALQTFTTFHTTLTFTTFDITPTLEDAHYHREDLAHIHTRPYASYTPRTLP